MVHRYSLSFYHRYKTSPLTLPSHLYPNPNRHLYFHTRPQYRYVNPIPHYHYHFHYRYPYYHHRYYIHHPSFSTTLNIHLYKKNRFFSQTTTPYFTMPSDSITSASHNNNNNNNNNMTSQAVIRSAEHKDTFHEASRRLHDGRLVAFPTETVYGLGAHALNPDAVRRIFAAKERPLSDPVIVHVPEPTDAFPLYHHMENNNQNTTAALSVAAVIHILADAFWPGPLTIVAPAARHVPAVVCAGSGYVGVRVPVHPTAQALLRHAGLPVAAPSANRFGHISPTAASHVWTDLQDKDVLIVDGGDTCSVGIESTVVQVEEVPSVTGTTVPQVRVLRRGGVPLHALRSTLSRSCGSTEVRLVLNHRNHHVSEGSDGTTTAAGDQEHNPVPQVAPGQSLRHYAPDCPAFLTQINRHQHQQQHQHQQHREEYSIADAAVIDFHGVLSTLRDQCRWYTDLSAAGDVDAAARRLFATLRDAEGESGIRMVLLPDLEELAAAAEDRFYGRNDQPDDEDEGTTPTNVDALYDRLYRSASGKRAVFDASASVIRGT